ncbi:MAG: PP2C family protein-serine/threonine phosphatase [bacterium]|nr:PP2C family protein-serine/threonine phosphatase [bacterium]
MRNILVLACAAALGCTPRGDLSPTDAAVVGDAGPLAAGTLLAAAGLLAVGLFFLRRRPGELFLLAFGAFAFFYGLRLLAETSALHVLLAASSRSMEQLRAWLTYVMPFLAFLSFEQLLGSGRRSTLRLVWQGFALFAVAAVVADAWTGKAGSAMGVSSVLVIIGIVAVWINPVFLERLRAPGTRVLLAGFVIFGVLALAANLEGLGLVPWDLDLEPVGLLILVGCLGWAGARQIFANERQLLAIENELETARSIQASILPHSMPEIAGLRVAARYLPASSVAGDFYDFLEVDEHRLGVLVADVSGHGVPAALIASMVKVAISAQSEHAAEPAVVLERMNRIFLGKLQRQFVTAAYLFVDLERGTLTHASGGHPPPLLWRRATRTVEELPGRGPLLGRFAEARFENAAVSVEPGDRVVLFTDGVVEARGVNDEQFGEERLRQAIEAHAELPAEDLVEALLVALSRWSGTERGESQDDDVTLLVVEIVQPGG